MTKGILGDVCFGDTLLKRHIVFLERCGRVTAIEPFKHECEGVILSDEILMIVSADILPHDVLLLQHEFKSATSCSNFLKLPIYLKFAVKSLENCSLIELGECK